MGVLNMYFYSPSTDVFIPESLVEVYRDAGTLPIDLIEVSIAVYEEYAAGATPEGKVRRNVEGFPAWVDAPPPTPAEIIAAADAEKARKLEEVASRTELWRTQLSLGILSEKDKAQLRQWMLYAQTLQDTDTSLAPDVTFPTIPQ